MWFSLFCLLTVLRRVCYLVTVKAAENNSKQFKVSKINQLPVLFVSVTIKPEIEIGSCCHACFCEGGRWNRGVRISRFLYFCAPLPPDSNLSAYQTLKYKCTCVVYHAISWPMTSSNGRDFQIHRKSWCCFSSPSTNLSFLASKIFF